MNDAPGGIEARFALGETDIQVEVANSDGRVLGTVGKPEAHVPPGILHRTFFLFLFGEQGRMLLQRRTGPKYHSPLLLTNAACSHPLSEEPVADAIERRAREELGADVSQLEEIDIVIYQVIDGHSGLAEHEYNHVYTDIIDPKSTGINPDEVDEVMYMTPRGLVERHADEPMTGRFNHIWSIGTEKSSKYGFDIAGVSGIHGPAEARVAAQPVSERDI